MTRHHIYYSGAQNMSEVDSDSVHLVVTSPPYPMIEMWDDIMMLQNPSIKTAFEAGDYNDAYEYMHEELDKVWSECHRVLRPGGIACINIGDATRTLNQNFKLYPNHSRIIQACLKIGFQNLPNIIWRKPTNAPNKFMGSGMYPPGAYVTLEHEYILIFRKGGRRIFKTKEEKENRRRSSYFWEERNMWFSDVWDIRGTRQGLLDKATRSRSAAYPFEVPYRLINMFSVMGDVVLDPFVGTGSTTLAAMATARHSVGVEIDPGLSQTIADNLLGSEEMLTSITEDRIKAHREFVKNRIEQRGEGAFKYHHPYYNFPIMTRQEVQLILPTVQQIEKREAHFEVHYKEI